MLPDWLTWIAIVWLALSLPVCLLVAWILAVGRRNEPEPVEARPRGDHGRSDPSFLDVYSSVLSAGLGGGTSDAAAEGAGEGAAGAAPIRVLVVDDDDGLRALLRTTLELERIEVDEADSAAAALDEIDRSRPSAIVLDVGMPIVDGLTLCRALKQNPATATIPVILLSGLSDPGHVSASGADAFLRKPFSPLELVGLVQKVVGRPRLPLAQTAHDASRDQLIAYASDLRLVLENSLRQQAQLQGAYRQTVQALAMALESKDTGTRAHSQRVVSYATELTLVISPLLLDDPGLECGFLLHDIGKIGVPDRILNKPGPLTPAERRVMERHAPLGAALLADVQLLDGPGLDVVRSHHERWDGTGYPEGMKGRQTPLAARVFAVADALDAMTSDRPYRPAASWDEALGTIAGEAGRQFDPDVVHALDDCDDRLRSLYAATLVG